jgi:seryl-tRNA(Sec) selenium transferase
VTTEIALDPTRPIPRLRVRVDPRRSGLTAAEVAAKLALGHPSIRCRSHHLSEGIVEIDPRALRSDELEIVARAIAQAVGAARSGDARSEGSS